MKLVVSHRGTIAFPINFFLSCPEYLFVNWAVFNADECFGLLLHLETTKELGKTKCWDQLGRTWTDAEGKWVNHKKERKQKVIFMMWHSRLLRRHADPCRRRDVHGFSPIIEEIPPIRAISVYVHFLYLPCIPIAWKGNTRVGAADSHCRKLLVYVIMTVHGVRLKGENIQISPSLSNESVNGILGFCLTRSTLPWCQPW